MFIFSNYDDFMEVRVGTDVEYGFDQHWTFNHFKDYIFGLVDIMAYPLEFVEVTQVSSRDVDRFVHLDDPNLYLYLDQQSGLPLLVRKDGKIILSVSSYTILAGHKELENLTLELLWSDQPAKLQLSFGEHGWLPSRLEVEQPNGLAIMEFSNWSFSSDWEIEASQRLKKLKNLNDAFFERFDDQSWGEALKTHKRC